MGSLTRTSMLVAALCLVAACSGHGSATDAASPKDQGGPIDAASAPDSGLCFPGVCTPANPCHAGYGACTDMGQDCTDTQLPGPDGVACGSNQTCKNGSCAACVAGAPCPPSGGCQSGVVVCGATPSCMPTSSLEDGSGCTLRLTTGEMSGYCKTGQCEDCVFGGTSCQHDYECCSQLCNGTCGCGGATYCHGNSDCCSGICNIAAAAAVGLCAQVGVGASCSASPGCTSNHCVGSVCACNFSGGACVAQSDCCAGTCSGQTCACSKTGQACATLADCCAPATGCVPGDGGLHCQ
jgi:hypothetical protein